MSWIVIPDHDQIGQACGKQTYNQIVNNLDHLREIINAYHDPNTGVHDPSGPYGPDAGHWARAYGAYALSLPGYVWNIQSVSHVAEGEFTFTFASEIPEGAVVSASAASPGWVVSCKALPSRTSVTLRVIDWLTGHTVDPASVGDLLHLVVWRYP